MESQRDMKSRLPVLHPSSPDSGLVRKRKATDDLGDVPSKAQAILDNANPASDRPNLHRTLTRSSVAAAPPTRPPKAGPSRPPPSNTSKPLGRSIRAGSAPPRSRSAAGIVNGKRALPDSALVKSTMARAVSSTSSRTVTPVDEERWDPVQEQVASLTSMMDADRAKVAGLEAFRSKLGTDLTAAKNQESETRMGMIRAADELDEVKRRHARQLQDMELESSRKDRELKAAVDALRDATDELARERESSRALKDALAKQATVQQDLETKVSALAAQCAALKGEKESHLNSKSKLALNLDTAGSRIVQLEQELRDAEALRRKLHNQVQELKGNIRVFCRVRPALSKESESGEVLARIAFPDKLEHKDIVISKSTESAMGTVKDAVTPFTFDHVFKPSSSQEDVFEEISHLSQSCIDGYNVCIFAYGQTGSGKSFTMEGGQTEQTRGMIPRAVRHVFAVAEDLRRKGWNYRMEGQFLEIYNETIVDLLGNPKQKATHKIEHDKTGRTTVADVVVHQLHSPDQVQVLLSTAQKHRTVHATKMNERSSRSHSVFTLRILGSNAATGESCEGCLNLVDLAGSERLKESGAQENPERLKETQSINSSLSALRDVITALAEKGPSGVIPYRNSKLTDLLKNSLSGNSKTLMFVNMSPLGVHLNESICSLRFATTVNNTTLGTAKKQPARKS